MFTPGSSLRRLGIWAMFALVASVAFAPPNRADAQGPSANWKVVANIRDSKQTTEKWAWFADEISKRTNGRLTLQVSTFPELGLTGTEFIRLLSIGLIDAGELVTGYVSGEVPLVEGVQMMGVYDSLAQAQKAYAAWTKRVILPNAKKVGGKPVASFAFANMYLWSKFPVNSLEDLKRKKIRIFSTAQANYLKALGAEPVSIPLAEVYPALERGVVDAVITGPDVANRTKLYEIVGYVTDLMFGPGAGWVVISDQTWSSLSPDLRSAVEGLLPELQQRGWELAFQENEENLKAVMAHGVKATIPVKPEWRDKLQEIARKVVIPAWATRAGPDGVAAFNEAIAPIVGVTATK